MKNVELRSETLIPNEVLNAAVGAVAQHPLTTTPMLKRFGEIMKDLSEQRRPTATVDEIREGERARWAAALRDRANKLEGEDANGTGPNDDKELSVFCWDMADALSNDNPDHIDWVAECRAKQRRESAPEPLDEAKLVETLRWLHTVVLHECPPPERPHEGSCHPDAGCDGTCSDAYYHGIEMTKAHHWIAKLEARAGHCASTDPSKAHHWRDIRKPLPEERADSTPPAVESGRGADDGVKPEPKGE